MKTNKPVATLSQRLELALSDAGMKAADLSRITGIPTSSISQYLSGYASPRQDRIYSMAQALDVAIPWLLGFDVSKEKSESEFEEIHIVKRLTPYIHSLISLPRDKQEIICSLINSMSNTEGGDAHE